MALRALDPCSGNWLATFRARSDFGSLAAQFRRDNRVQIPSFLCDEFARRLRDELLISANWTKLINAGERTFEIPSSEYQASEQSLKSSLDEALYSEARYSFRYRYDVIRVPDRRPVDEKVGESLSAFANLIALQTALDLLHGITGGKKPRFADAQATRYLPGDFLTRHDDEAAGANRSFAYVLSMVDEWPAEWGGLLHFFDEKGEVTSVFTPKFNCLSIFGVPQPHSVSFVAPFAGAPRISVTGWLRTEVPR